MRWSWEGDSQREWDIIAKKYKRTEEEKLNQDQRSVVFRRKVTKRNELLNLRHHRILFVLSVVLWTSQPVQRQENKSTDVGFMDRMIIVCIQMQCSPIWTAECIYCYSPSGMNATASARTRRDMRIYSKGWVPVWNFSIHCPTHKNHSDGCTSTPDPNPTLCQNTTIISGNKWPTGRERGRKSGTTIFWPLTQSRMDELFIIKVPLAICYLLPIGWINCRLSRETKVSGLNSPLWIFESFSLNTRRLHRNVQRLLQTAAKWRGFLWKRSRWINKTRITVS